MPAVLRASGPTFDPDAFASHSPWHFAKIYHRGEPVLASKPHAKAHHISGFNVDVSHADFDNLTAQVADAIAFFQSFRDELSRLKSFPGVDEIVLDIGIKWRDTYTHSDHLPAALLLQAGSAGIDIVLS